MNYSKLFQEYDEQKISTAKFIELIEQYSTELKNIVIVMRHYFANAASPYLPISIFDPDDIQNAHHRNISSPGQKQIASYEKHRPNFCLFREKEERVAIKFKSRNSHSRRSSMTQAVLSEDAQFVEFSLSELNRSRSSLSLNPLLPRENRDNSGAWFYVKKIRERDTLKSKVMLFQERSLTKIPEMLPKNHLFDEEQRLT